MTGKSYIKVFDKGKWRDQHRVIMEKVLGRPLRKDEIVHHINGDFRDNRVENLVITTPAEHTQMHHGGELSKYAKLNNRKIKMIRWAVRKGWSLAMLAKCYGVHRTVLGKAMRGVTWKCVYRP
jgi:hypothetical protein